MNKAARSASEHVNGGVVPMSKWIMMLVALAMSGLALAGPASAKDRPYGTLSPVFDQVGDGAPVHQQRIAINRSTGRLYVTDDTADQVRVFDATAISATEGTPFGLGDVTDPLGVAVDQATGAVYVSDDNSIIKYSSGGTLDAFFASPAGVTGPIAFDQNANQLVVADTATNQIRRYSPTGLPGTSFDGSDGGTTFTGLQDIAVTPAGDIYVIDADGDPATGATSHIEKYTAAGHHQATVGPVDGAATIAVNATGDRVFVSGNQDAVNTDGYPTLSVFSTADLATPFEQIYTGTLQWDTIRGLAVDDGPTARLYVGTDVGIYPPNSYGTQTLQIAERPAPSAPVVTTRQAGRRTTTSVQLNAIVDPQFQSTTHYFEYGMDTTYGTVSPTQPAYTGFTTPQAVSQTVDGLQPGATYHYRVVATNATGTSYGADRAVTTLAAPPVARAYEQVTPVSKNGVDLRVNSTNEVDFPVAASGNSIEYVTGGSYGDAPTSNIWTFYRADRSSDAWTSTPTDVPYRNKTDFASRPWWGSTLAVSEDLSHSVVGSREALTPGAVEQNYNLYLRDNASGALQLIFTTPTYPINSRTGAVQVDGSSDFSHVVLIEYQALTPDAPDNGLGKLYEFTGGRLRLASIMPDGTPATEPVYYNNGATALKHMISEDGSRIFFSLGGSANPGSAGLFVREGGQTRPISVSQRTGDGPEVRMGAVLDASADGSVVYFTSDAPLTDTTTGTLYRYDLSTGSLTNLPTGGVLAASRDGQRVYFASGAKLTPTGVEGAYNVYVWHAGQLHLVVTETGPGAGPGGPGGRIGRTGQGGGSPNFRLSPDGRLALFTTWEKTPDYDNVNPLFCPTSPGDQTRPANQCQKLYFFDPDADGVQCVSCNPNGERPTDDAQLGQGDGRSVTDDGRVFFNSPDRLVAGDVNGKYDAYQWHDGELSLISTGTSDDDSIFVNASDDGRDLFFATSQQLVGQDTDNVVDLYDAREGGGLAGQARVKPSAPCSEDDCQPAGSARSAPPSIGTLVFTGPGGAVEEPESRGKVSVARPTSVKGASGVLRVKAPGKGRVTVSGSGIGTVTRSVSKAGTVSISVSLTSKARSTLRKRHRFATTLRVVFKPSAGSVSTAKVALTFKAVAAKKGR
jgi:hypothetical protein